MKRIVKLILVIVIPIAIIVPVIFLIISIGKSATLNILVTPLDSTVSINGANYANGTYRFFPGEVSVKIEHEGLDTKEYNIELKSSTTTLLYDYLSSGEDFSYYESHPADYKALKFVYDDTALDFINKRERANSITDILPLNAIKYYPPTNYKIIVKNASQESNCTSLVCLKIFDDSDGRFASADLLREYGYDINDYQVFYASE